jgi:hypothetical protein
MKKKVFEKNNPREVRLKEATAEVNSAYVGKGASSLYRIKQSIII